jgi:hypothetical protein
MSSKAHPSLSPIVERQSRYYYIIITPSANLKSPGRGYPFQPPQLIKLLSDSEKRQVVNHLRVLQVAFAGRQNLDQISRISEEIALGFAS